MDTMKDQTISIEAMWRRLVAHGRAVGIFVLAATLATAIVVFHAAVVQVERVAVAPARRKPASVWPGSPLLAGD